jgi:hypothetical protein
MKKHTVAGVGIPQATVITIHSQLGADHPLLHVGDGSQISAESDDKLVLVEQNSTEA